MMIQNANRSSLIGQVGQTSFGLSKILERLSTGRRINRASDDAAGLAIAENLMAQVRGFRQATDNVSYASAAMQIGEGAGNEISSILQRQRELALQASNDTLTDDQRASLDQEYQALTAESDRIANSSQFNTQGTAAGSGLASGTAKVQAGANAGDEVTLPAADFQTAALGTSGTGIATAANARNAVSSVTAAIDNLNSQRSNIGASINRFEHTVSNLNNQTINTQEAESSVRDLDFAMGMADLVRQNLLNQTSISSLQHFNQVSGQNLLALLR